MCARFSVRAKAINKGLMKDGTQVISKRNVQHIFSNGAGSAVTYSKTSPLGIPQALTRCYSDLDISNPILDLLPRVANWVAKLS